MRNVVAIAIAIAIARAMVRAIVRVRRRVRRRARVRFRRNSDGQSLLESREISEGFRSARRPDQSKTGGMRGDEQSINRCFVDSVARGAADKSVGSARESR